MPKPRLSPCAELVRRQDPDRFVTALFGKEDDREALMTLYAFNAEIAAIRERVREPMAGLVRLQWWHDWLEAALRDEDRDHHPVTSPLGCLIRERRLPVSLFHEILDARERDLGTEPPSDWDEVEAYAAATGGTLSRLAVLSLRGDEKVEWAAIHAGTAYALVGLARALPAHLSMGRLTVPSGVAGDQHFTEAAKGLCALAIRHLETLSSLRQSRSVLPCLLPAVLAKRYVKALKSAGWNPLSTAAVNRIRAPLALSWAMIRGNIG